MEALVLDFDGVISDSAGEAFDVALRTYRRLHPDSRLRADEGIRRRFVAMMPLGNRAEDFGTALAAIEQDRSFDDQAAYDAFRALRAREWIDAFHRVFYEVRHAWAQQDRDDWLGRMRPYAPVAALLRRNAGRARYAIATSKDGVSVNALLQAYGLRDLFPPELVLDKESGPDKAAHLQALAARTGIAPEQMTFVDDKVNHLDRVADLGVDTVLATWGFNGEREHALARQHGHRLCTLDDAQQVLFGDAAVPAADAEGGA